MKSHFPRPADTASAHETLINLLRWRAENQPELEVYQFLEPGQPAGESLTYRELDLRARAIAAHLQEVSGRGERALLLYPPGLEFIAAFFGCLYAGVIAVPAYPPRFNRNLLRVQSIISDAAATVTMTTGPILAKVQGMMEHAPALKRMRWVNTETVGGGPEGGWKEPDVTGGELAFLQYTSGSTGSPKGVMLSHSNLLHNASLVYRALEHAPSDKYVSWLPTFHDMGFMAGVLQPLYGGFPVVLMSPAAFLQSPLRWLQAITEHRGTTSGGPNFAYDLCVSKISPEQRASLDLSSWTTAFNGAEPVRHETIERFVAAFEPCGFRREAFYPCYGLAEATLIVSGGRKGRPPVAGRFRAEALENNRVEEAAPGEGKNARSLVGCGGPLFEQQVVIADPESRRRCGPAEVGEIWVSGPSVAAGYWNRPEQTEDTFRARLADTGEGPFLRTEDLGFMRDGELFIAGRKKDLIIIRGRNHYPQDIELTVERSHPALRPGCGAAFSVEVGGEERLVVVQEAENPPGDDPAPVIESIRRAVSDEHELQVHAVTLVKPRSIPKTSSGKIQRRACRADFLAGNLEAVGRSVLGEAAPAPAAPSLTREELLAAEETERLLLLWNYLQEAVARVLKVNPAQVNPRTPINTLGLDSLMAVELQYAIESGLGVNVPMASFLQETSLASLAARILSGLAAPSAPAVAPAPAADEGATHPLSYGQRSLWFLYHADRESAAYNIARAVRVLTPLDARALRSALQELVDRHPSLRTTFAAAGGQPAQRVHRECEVAFREEDASALPEEAFRARLAEEAARPFDLENGPLFRVLLFERSPSERVLLLAMHHIVADLWSLAVLMHELGILYQARVTGAAPVLTPAEASYVDFARWQAATLEGPEGERHWDYWRGQLAGELPVLDLLTDRPRPAVQTFNGAARSVTFSPELARGLKDLARGRGATLYMTLLAAFEVLLHRYTGEEEIVVGSSTAGRSRGEFAGVVGYFVNPVALRANLAGDPTFGEFLDRVRRDVLAAFEHQDYPVALLVERLQPRRDPARPPLFQVMFGLQKSHLLNEEGLAAFALGEAGARLELGGLTFESLPLEQRAAQFDLTLMMAEVGEGLAASLEYNTDLFDGETIERLLGHFRTLLEGVAAGADRRLSELPLMAAAERRQALTLWNETATEYDRRRFVHRLIEEQAESAPDAPAVVYGERRLSYGELDRRADRLARYLQASGVGPEVRVGILLERSPEMVVALLAVLKAGGAYVPLDPAYPRERLEYMLADAQVPLCLTQRGLGEGLSASAARMVCVDADGQVEAGAFDDAGGAVRDGVGADNLAYVIYTSGSTGRPKGAMITHGGLLNYLNWARDFYRVAEGRGAPVHSSVSFDLTVTSLFAPLTAGRPVVLLPEDGGVEALSDALRAADNFSLVKITPVHLHILSGLLPPGEAAGRARAFVIGGEALLEESLSFWRGNAPDTRLINEYGPTETVVGCCVHEATVKDPLTAAVPIGRPIANTQLYILDARLQPVPAGVAGELYIGGAGVARGYLNRPALTAEKFIPDPFSPEPGARLYRTGDLARRRADGLIDFLGRLDRQVKVRGFRIELGEVEAALSSHPGVGEAVVTTRDEGAGEKRLVAYVVASAQGAPDASDLRLWLQGKLPAHMIPAAFVLLDRIPLTPNGKVDLRALPPPPGREQARTAEAYVAPRSVVEEKLADAWAQVLGVERVGIHDNFFALGGDSILSIQLVARARRDGISLTPRQLFRHQTVAELAAAAEGFEPNARAEEGRRAAELPVSGPLPLTPVQHWFFEQELPNPHHWNQSVLLETREALHPSALEEALQRLLLHHDALRLRFTRGGADWRQAVGDAPERVSFRAVELAALSDAEERRAVEEVEAELQSGLNISQGPLVRAAYFRRGAERPGWLLLVIHHLAVDGVSWRILLEDLANVYGQLVRGEAVRLPPKTTSYQEWAERLTQYAHAHESEQEASYWLELCDRQCARLPTDFEAGANTEASARAVRSSLSAEETRSLLQQVLHVTRAQINEVLLSALARVLSGWAQGPLPVELEGHGREELFEGVDTSRTVGWFTSLFPFILEAGRETPPAAALKLGKERLRQIPRRGVGYGVLRYLRADSDFSARLRSLPRPEVSFNYLGQFDQVFNTSPVFSRALEQGGHTRDPRGPRRYLLEIDGRVVEGRLQLDWRYSEDHHRRETVERLAEEFTAALRSLISECADAGADYYVPADFPQAGLSPATLERLVREYGPPEDVYPLSPVQSGMLFHTLYAPESDVYVEQFSFILGGDFDVAAFERAWEQVCRRHTTLRTAFVWENLDEPLQVVVREAEPVWERNDCRGLSPAEERDRLEALLRAERTRGFDLSKAAPMRLMLNRLGDGRYQFVWTYHHLLLDGWSLPVVLGDVLALAEALRQGRELHLEPGRPYADYVRWLRRRNLGDAEAFWRKALEGFNAPTPLGVDRAAPAHAPDDRGDAYAERQTSLPAATTARLEAFARQHQLTLNTLLQGAWALILSRYSGEADVVYGVAVSGRSMTLAGAERVVGPFINTVPARARVAADAPVLEWLRELQSTQAETREFEYAPLVQIQGWSEVPRSLPLFESLFVFENYPVDASLRQTRGGLRIEGVDFFERTNYPLMVQAVPGEALLFKVTYDRRRFDDDAIERLLGHLQTLLLDLTARPESRVGTLRLLTEAERRRTLREWNDTHRAYPRQGAIHELFEAQVERTPEAVAVVCRGQRVSYRELNRRANRLAHRLRRLGVGPEVLVGLCTGRSVEMLVGLLGVLKAGGAYVPLDPAYPEQRLAFMLEDAAAPVLLTERGLSGRFPESRARVLLLDDDGGATASERDDNPAATLHAENLAYLIYTSGSTGRPKGVAIRHGSAATLLRWAGELFTAQELAGVLASTSICFDLSVFELFAPLSTGGKVVLVENALAAGEAPAGEVTLVNTVPSAMAELVRAGLVPSGARAVNLAGEALKGELARRVYELGHVERLFNLYGPSEDTTYSTAALVPRGADAEPSIGRPVADTQVYVLDPWMELVPTGVVGEVYIGGAGLARGYLNRPALTAEKFIPDPFSAEPGGRLYRTGDLARYRPDGEIDYVARVDQQVKIRGFRIEPGEVEAGLYAHEWVREAVVTVREDEPGEKRLVAYYVADAAAGEECERELRRHLRGRVPEYMVPSAFVRLAELPLTPNGKVDRKALPAPDALKREPGRGYVAPRNAVEARLVELWEEVLGVSPVGVHDNFFDLGGHSLTAVQLLARLRRDFQPDISLRDVMAASSVAELAAALGAGRPRPAPAQRPTRHEAGEALPLSFAQQRLWFLSQLQPDVALYNCPGAVRLEGRLDAGALVRALEEIVRRHEVLRTIFPASEQGEPVQTVLPPGPLDPRVIDLRGLAAGEREDEVRRLMTEEAQRPFDLTRDRLLRVTLLRLEEEQTVLLLTAHHIVVDAWSMGVLVRELAVLYRAFSAGGPSPLPELPIQYADFAVWQRGWLQGEVLAEQLRYWKRVLGGRLPTLELPAVRPRPRRPTHHGARQTFTLDRALTPALEELSRREGVTLFTTLLAAFQTLLHRYTKQDDIIVATAIANRPVEEVEGLVGCFINTLALRTDFSGGPRFRELLRRVREVAVGALSHQDLPFEKLVDEILPERSLSTLSVAQVAFGLQNSPMPPLELPSLRLTQLEVDDHIARLDLTLWIEPRADGLRASWTYSTDLFDAAAVERMHVQYETLLRSIVANPGAPLEALEMTSAEEREHLKAREKRREESNYQRLLKVRPKSVGTPQQMGADD